MDTVQVNFARLICRFLLWDKNPPSHRPTRTRCKFRRPSFCSRVNTRSSAEPEASGAASSSLRNAPEFPAKTHRDEDERIVQNILIYHLQYRMGVWGQN